MRAFPSIDELEIELLAGQGIAIIVEGDSYAEDPFFYGQWFGDRARDVTFFPQDGWAQVIRAVAELRQRCSAVPIYGIIDRDFCEANALDADFETKGILRTRQYTLENYLLDPNGWAKVFQFIFRAHPGGAKGWDDVGVLPLFINQAFGECFVLSAHNRAIKFGNDNFADQAVLTPEKSRCYLEVAHALEKDRAVQKLQGWGEQLGAGAKLIEIFEEHLATLNQADLSHWQQHISGKYVLDWLHRRFPKRPGAGQFDLKHYLNEYLRACPEPPPEITELINRIVQHARK